MYSERTLRKRAKAIGKVIKKGFTRVPGGGIITDNVGERWTGYRVFDLETGKPELRDTDANTEFGWSLEDVETYLRSEYEQRSLKW